MVIAAWCGGAFFGAWVYRLGRNHERRKEDLRQAQTVLTAAPSGDGQSTAPGVEAADSDDDRLLALERAQKMLQGRMNRIAPPRKGTGEPSEEPEIVAPVASQGPPILTGAGRSAIVAEYHRRRGR